MTSFIVHAQGFVLETTAALLRDRGAEVVEAPEAERARWCLTEAPTAVFVGNAVPDADSWADRHVVLLDGVDDRAVAQLRADGASVTRPEHGSGQALLDAAFGPEPARSPSAPVQLPPNPEPTDRCSPDASWRWWS